MISTRHFCLLNFNFNDFNFSKILNFMACSVSLFEQFSEFICRLNFIRVKNSFLIMPHA